MFHFYLFSYKKILIFFISFVINIVYAQTNLQSNRNNNDFTLQVLELNQKAKNAKKDKKWNSYFTLQQKLANLYIQKKQWKLAKIIIEKNIYKSQKKEATLSLAHNYRQLAQWYELQLQSSKALQLFEKALQTYRTQLPEKNNWIAQVYCDIGVLYLQEHNFYKAKQHLFKSLNLQNTKNIRLASRVYENIAALYKHKKILKLAETYLQKSLELKLQNYNANDLYLTSTYLQFAYLYIEVSKPEKATLYLEKILSIYEKQGKRHTQELAEAYYIFGKIKEKLSFKVSFDFYEKSLTIYQHLYTPFSPKLSRVFLAMAQNKEKQNSFWQALEFYQKSIISNAKNFKDSVLFSNPKVRTEEEANEDNLNDLFEYYQEQTLLKSLYGKANTLRKMYLENKAQIHYLKLAYETIVLSDKILQKITNNPFCQIQTIEETWEEIIQQNNNLGIEVCLELYDIAQERKFFEKAFYFSERSKSNVLLKSMSDSRNKKYIEISDSLKQAEDKIIRQISLYEQKLTHQPDSLKAVMYQDELFVLNKAYENLQQVIAEKCTPCFVNTSNIIPNINTIQEKLDKQTALLAYNFAKEKSYVFIITKEKYATVSLESKDKIQVLLNDFYNHIQNESSIEKFVKPSFTLYENLLKPLKIYLSGKKNLLIIEPLLLSIPFEAIITEPNKSNNQDFGKLSYLLNQYNISYHYSSALWYFRKNENVQQKSNFLGFAPFADKATGVFKTINLEYLPNTNTELGQIYRIFQKSGLYAETYFSEFASKEKFLEKAKYFSILHIASHSRPDFENEKMGKIYLADWNNPYREASLLAGNIYHLDISANLVVLSSCESGVGKFTNSEGVLSLARSFLHAGAKNIISSLWEVDDKYTSELMISFYQQVINRQKTYTQALRIAKRSLQKNHKNLHPKYWSDFILIGREGL